MTSAGNWRKGYNIIRNQLFHWYRWKFMGKDLNREAKGGGVMLWAFQRQSRTIEDVLGLWVWSSCLRRHCQIHFLVNSTWLAPLPVPVATLDLGSLILALSQKLVFLLTSLWSFFLGNCSSYTCLVTLTCSAEGKRK